MRDTAPANRTTPTRRGFTPREFPISKIRAAADRRVFENRHCKTADPDECVIDQLSTIWRLRSREKLSLESVADFMGMYKADLYKFMKKTIGGSL